MTSIDTNDAFCPGLMFHFDTSRAGVYVSFKPGKLAFQPKSGGRHLDAWIFHTGADLTILAYGIF